MEVVVRFNNGEGLKSVLQEVCIIDFSKLYVVELYVYMQFLFKILLKGNDIKENIYLYFLMLFYLKDNW